jgi:hypothetical protein
MSGTNPYANLSQATLNQLAGLLEPLERLVDADSSVGQVDVGERKCNFFRGSHSCKEAELIVVSLRFSPVTMNCRDECFRVLHAEWVDRILKVVNNYLGGVVISYVRADVDHRLNAWNGERWVRVRDAVVRTADF